MLALEWSGTDPDLVTDSRFQDVVKEIIYNENIDNNLYHFTGFQLPGLRCWFNGSLTGCNAGRCRSRRSLSRRQVLLPLTRPDISDGHPLIQRFLYLSINISDTLAHFFASIHILNQLV